MNGNMDEISIWSIPLTQTDVSALYNNGKGLSYTDTTTVFNPKLRSFTMPPYTSTYIRKAATDTLEATYTVHCTPVGFF
jgi:hypothetical protein